jgi:hypothetical protein
MATTKKPAAKKTAATRKAQNAAAPRKKPGAKPVAQNKLDALGVDWVVAAISDGKTYRHIANVAGVGLGTLATWIEADPERSRACARARELSAQAFEERAEEAIADAKDMFELAKAKELAAHWRWRAKAVNPKSYGDKVDIKGELGLKALPQTQIDEELGKLLAKAGLTSGPGPDTTAAG